MVRITGERAKHPLRRPPPRRLLLVHRPGDSEEDTRRFVSRRLARLGFPRLPEGQGGGKERVAAQPGGELSLYISSRTFSQVLAHCASLAHRRLEALGFLVGELYRWQKKRYSVVGDLVTGELESTSTSVRFRRDAFQTLCDRLDELDYDYVLIGWYHSHPGYSSFLSAVDMDTQRRMFTRPFHVALVADPVGGEVRAFRIREGRCLEVPYAVFG
ncbi:MAG: Mov34/MPN/PAD-1 family protein [Thermoplasmatota archaeon]